MTYAFSQPEQLRITIEKLCKDAGERVNTGISKVLTTRQSTEHPPKGARHLTDTRGRVSTLLEYALAYEMSSLLANGASGYTISNVLWNSFPDLILRDPRFENFAGLEVKALHTAAEEKSANLDVNLSEIREGRDFLVILIWGWASEVSDGVALTFPKIHEIGVFSAWNIARIRDYGWLSGTRVSREKAFDLRSPVIAADLGFKAEEGNYGKLMRIQLPEGLPNDLPAAQQLSDEYKQYAEFKARAIALSLRETFTDVCDFIGATSISSRQVKEYPKTCCELGHAAIEGRKIYLIAGPNPVSYVSAKRGQSSEDRYIFLSPKLEWAVFAPSDGMAQLIDEGKKPDSDLPRIKDALFMRLRT